MTAATLSLADFIQALPKTETHLHVEGALPYELLHAWQPERWGKAPAFRARSYRYATFPDFEKILLDHALPWFTTAERYYEAAKVIVQSYARWPGQLRSSLDDALSPSTPP